MEKNEAVKPTSRTLTHATLMAEGPCSTYRARFTERFPEKVEVTVELAVSQASDWDWYWAAEQLLSRDGYRHWKKQLAASEEEHYNSLRPYEDLLSNAWDVAYRVREADFEELHGVRGKNEDDAWDAATQKFREALVIPRAALDAASEIANERRQQARAKAWAEIYIAEGEDS
jgi:hypothetical protein